MSFFLADLRSADSQSSSSGLQSKFHAVTNVMSEKTPTASQGPPTPSNVTPSAPKMVKILPKPGTTVPTGVMLGSKMYKLVPLTKVGNGKLTLQKTAITPVRCPYCPSIFVSVDMLQTHKLSEHSSGVSVPSKFSPIQLKTSPIQSKALPIQSKVSPTQPLLPKESSPNKPEAQRSNTLTPMQPSQSKLIQVRQGGKLKNVVLVPKGETILSSSDVMTKNVNLTKSSGLTKADTITLADILELTREFEDFSNDCKICSFGLKYLDKFKIHAKKHPIGDPDCSECHVNKDACRLLITHLEKHIVNDEVTPSESD